MRLTPAEMRLIRALRNTPSKWVKELSYCVEGVEDNWQEELSSAFLALQFERPSETVDADVRALGKGAE